MNIYFYGLMLGLSLTMALGPQNLFLIRQGAKRNHIFLSGLVCFSCDSILIIASIIGLHKLVDSHSLLKQSLAYLGSAFLITYGLIALKSSFIQAKQVSFFSDKYSRSQIILLALGFSLINPHAIIDTLFIIGGTGSQFPDHEGLFLLGVMSSSLLWISSILFTTSIFSSFITKAKIWSKIEFLSGTLMVTLGLRLLL